MTRPYHRLLALIRALRRTLLPEGLVPGAVLSGVLLALLLTLAPAALLAAPASLPAAPLAAALPARWNLGDQNGQRWQLALFEQPDPAYPSGWRLRLNALSPAQAPDQQRSLEVSDSLGRHWSLANVSAELVPPGEEIPAGSAQFRLDDLSPRPSEALPLQLNLPLRDGGTAELTPGAETVTALHELPAA